MTNMELVAAVKAHARTNYEKDGWDYIVECFSDEDIAKEIGTARTLNGAIKSVKRIVRELNARRREVQAEIF